MQNSDEQWVDIGPGCQVELNSTRRTLAELVRVLPNNEDRLAVAAAVLVLNKLALNEFDSSTEVNNA